MAFFGLLKDPPRGCSLVSSDPLYKDSQLYPSKPSSIWNYTFMFKIVKKFIFNYGFLTKHSCEFLLPEK